MRARLLAHLPEYAIEACALAAFLVSATGFTMVLEHPASPVRALIDSALLRRVLMGLAMGATLVAIVYSPWGRRSGAHMNPALTLTFLRLGKVHPADAAGYIGAQFIGASAVMLLLAAVARPIVGHPSVNYVNTLPGPAGIAAAAVAEVVISFGLLFTVLTVSNGRHMRLTGLVAGLLVASYITLEAPLSGMSMNPARTFGPSLAGWRFGHLWIYFVAPLAGMLLAAEAWRRVHGRHPEACAKYDHDPRYRCIHCGHEPSLPIRHSSFVTRHSSLSLP